MLERVDVVIEPATQAHGAELAANIREDDRRELWRSGMMSPEDALSRSLATANRAWAGWVNDDLVAIFGVTSGSLFTQIGAPWLMSSVAITKHPSAVARICPPYISKMQEGYRLLTNYVDVENVVAVKWLTWLGFKIEDPEPYGMFGFPFHKFTLKGTALCA